MSAIYIHIPYCLGKCAYCDFHSLPIAASEIPHEAYARALLKQLKRDVARLNLSASPVETLFFGGGTPSLMPTSFFSEVIAGIDQQVGLTANAEITIEANPATVSGTWFHEVRTLGVNRISLGVQTFHPELLTLLGRRHTADEAMEAIALAQDASFPSLSVDLMFGIPGETTAMLEDDVRTVMTFQPNHISAYALTLEDGTPLTLASQQGTLEPLDDDQALEQFRIVARMLDRGKRPRYEISNFASPGAECRHNLNYWRYGNYLGLGSGATSFLHAQDKSATSNPQGDLFAQTSAKSADQTFARRWTQTRDVKAYLAGSNALESSEEIDLLTAMAEFCFLGLRTTEGITRTDFQHVFEIPLDDLYAETIEDLVRENLITDQGNRIALTQQGIEISNRVFERFLP